MGVNDSSWHLYKKYVLISLHIDNMMIMMILHLSRNRRNVNRDVYNDRKNVMLLSHSGEYPCECKNLIFAANSPKTIRLARIITETSEALQMVTNACEFLMNPCEFLTKLTIT